MNSRPSIFIRILRTLLLTVGVLLVMVVAYALWRPGAGVRDGRHDRGQNGLWLAHGWLGADAWFAQYKKEAELPKYRSAEALGELVNLCAVNRVTDLFPHLCPCEWDGSLPAVDAGQVERFLDATTPSCRVIPWIGGPGPSPARYQSPQWRAKFCASVRLLMEAHPRLAGVQVNIEPLPSGDEDFLKLLEELRAQLPPEKILSVAAYPPPTRWQQVPDIHWDEAYFRQVATRVDQLAVMMYDTGIRLPKFYEKLMADWTVEVLQWSEGKPVLLGVATYNDAGVGYHHPEVENLEHGLAGIHAGLLRGTVPANYRGVAVYCHWEMDDAEWRMWRERFLGK